MQERSYDSASLPDLDRPGIRKIRRHSWPLEFLKSMSVTGYNEQPVQWIDQYSAFREDPEIEPINVDQFRREPIPARDARAPKSSASFLQQVSHEDIEWLYSALQAMDRDFFLVDNNADADQILQHVTKYAISPNAARFRDAKSPGSAGSPQTTDRRPMNPAHRDDALAALQEQLESIARDRHPVRIPSGSPHQGQETGGGPPPLTSAAPPPDGWAGPGGVLRAGWLQKRSSSLTAEKRWRACWCAVLPGQLRSFPPGRAARTPPP